MVRSVRRTLQRGHRAVVVAVITVAVVQAALVEVVGVVAVRDDIMPAVAVPAVAGDRGVPGRVDCALGDCVLVVVAVVRRVQMAVVQIVDVALVLDSRVAAMLTVDVRMAIVCRVRHRSTLCLVIVFLMAI